MGIPSYYKRLLDSVGGILQKSHPGSIDWLWMDFNCLIYHCLRRPGTPEYPGHDLRIEWEKGFLEIISKYCQHIIKEVNPKKGVYIAIDGVVPMAKMRQQRLRRFKSAWLTEHGLVEGSDPSKESWDTNSITPGTEFMNQLAKSLSKLCEHKKGKVKWILSSSNEPGEGEHKIMEQWRTGEFMGSHAVYGLDADLIVLSLLNKKKEEPVWLFREQIEMGEVIRDETGDESYTWFSIDKLGEHLQPQIGDHTLTEYCFIMSVLGNDFLPSSLSYKMRDDGHEAILDFLKENSTNLLDQASGQILNDGLYTLFRWLAKSEQERIQRFVFKKNAMSRNYSDLKIGDNNWPLGQNIEKQLIDSENRTLVLNWNEIYHTEWLNGINKKTICSEYVYGLHWIWSYYTGEMNKICFNWYYPWNLPPLWSWLIESPLEFEFPGKLYVRREDILPTEQLCLVLPFQSWYLLGINKERAFFEKAPWFFPKNFGFGSIGKRYFWECEPEIPIPSIYEVKQILAL
jgi:5'-3' exonuclease